MLDLTASLLEKSLIHRMDQPDTEPRYLMLETVREYGLEQLAASGEETAVRDAHAAWVLAMVERTAQAWAGPDQALWLDRLEAERDNLRAALGWAAESPRIDVALRLIKETRWFWRVRGPAAEGRAWIDRILALPGRMPPDLRSWALLAAGDLTNVSGDPERAAVLADESVMLARACADLWLLAVALQFRGLVALAAGRPEDAQRFLTEALSLFRECGHGARISTTLNNLGTAARMLGEAERAVALQEEALALAEEEGYVWGAALNLGHLADAVRDLGDFSRAETLYREGVRRTWAQKDRRNFAGNLAGYAALFAIRGEPKRAARLVGAAEATLATVGATFAPAGRLSHGEAVAAASQALGEAVFAAARVSGAALTPEEAIEEALSDTAATEQIGTPVPASSGGLTRRELDVLRLLAAGRTNAQIADALFIEHRTVTTHVSNILGKLDVATRTEAAAYAIRHDLV